jgi:hypothetical protein
MSGRAMTSSSVWDDSPPVPPSVQGPPAPAPAPSPAARR